jgi:hypothetical protein
MPAADATGVNDELLNCELSQGCRPDKYLLVDGATGTSLSCSVQSTGTQFGVYINMQVDASVSGGPLAFSIAAPLSATGGSAQLSFAGPLFGGRDGDSCTITIMPDRGQIESGGIWAQFSCRNFRNEADISGDICAVTGAFFVENCQG